MRAGRKDIRALRRFLRGEEAGLSVEAVLVLPFMLWAFAALFSYFDVYRARSLAMKGNYAVSDLLSRETDPIDTAYLNGIEAVFTFITESDDESWIRVTPVHCLSDCTDPDTRVLQRDWSRATDGVDWLSNADVNSDYRDIVPMIASGERVIMVETRIAYKPPVGPAITGVTARDLRDTTFTRPRFAPQLCWGEDLCLNDD